MGDIPRDRLAAEAGVAPGGIDRLVAAGLLPDLVAGYSSGDVRRAQFLLAFDAAGFPLEQVALAIQSGVLSLDYLDTFYLEPSPLSGRTYAEFRASLGARGALLGRTFALLGLPEPGDAHPTRVEDEELLTEFLDTWGAAAADAPDRAARIIGESIRRLVDGWYEIYQSSLWRPEDVLGLPPDQVRERSAIGSRIAALGPRLIVWLQQRHVERVNAATAIGWVEQRMVERGLAEPRPSVPPAVAFVDVSGFTRTTQEAGDERALRIAIRLRDAADEAARRHGGAVVKLLGDGVLLRFRDAGGAIAAVLELRATLAADGIATHAGINAGPVIEREGDVFGRTVNLAARLGDRATSGQVLVTEAVAAALGPAGPAVRACAPAMLDGLAEPVAVFEVEPPAPPG